MLEPDPTPPAARSRWLRLAAALGAALVFAWGVYLLLDSTRPAAGLIATSFLLVLPAASAAFIAYVADPDGTAPLSRYLMVPVWLVLAVVILSALVLREGVICILILSPIWLIAATGGSLLTRYLRRRIRDGRRFTYAMMALPLGTSQIEPALPPPQAGEVVTRSTVVDATPDRIWPLLRGIPDVHPGEGRWNLTQDVIGVPRPLGARLVGSGVGATRLATWGRDIRFRERITEWRPGRRIGWRFDFKGADAWRLGDRHLLPDSSVFRVTTGGYALTPLPGGRTRVTLETRYTIRTPVNLYSQAWGELLLGDLERNLLGLVKDRAERGAPLTSPSA